MKAIEITKFAGRHFRADFAGTQVVGISSEELVELANTALTLGLTLIDGYAPSCKHLFIPNIGYTRTAIAEITDENRHLLRSGYVARREGELPVLTRWFEGIEAPRAEYLDLILYSREALESEADKAPHLERDVPEAQWGIVSINAELQRSESPMPPITMMRNALGKEEGGSGVPLNHEAYSRAVEFWETHATIK